MAHFLVGNAEIIAELVGRLYRKVARLLQEQFRTATRHVGSLECGAEHGAMVEVVKPKLYFVDELRQH